MSYSSGNFLRPVAATDASIRIMDDNNVVKFTVNPFSILNLQASNNILNISLKGGKVISVDFSSAVEAKISIDKLEQQISILTGKEAPFIDKQIQNYVQNKIDNISSITAPTFSITSVIEGDLIPSVDSQYDLGSTISQWKSLHVSGHTIYIGGVTLSTYDNSLVINNINLGSTSSPFILSVDSGNLTLNSDVFLGITGSTGPQGEKGDRGVAGFGIVFKGQLSSTYSLPSPSVQGYSYLIDDSLWVYDSNEWVDGGNIQGPQGMRGEQGIQGVTGAQGQQGIQGIQGIQGMQGVTGPQGIQGVTGSQGIQGVTGPQGIQGIQGMTGLQGIQGIQGVTGSRGDIYFWTNYVWYNRRC